MIAGFYNPKVFSSSANLTLLVFAGWFLFGLVAMQNMTVVNNTGFFGIFFAQPFSNTSQIIIAILGLFSLFLTLQGMFFAHRGRFY